MILILTVASGTSCPRGLQPVAAPPVVFSGEPSLAGLIAVINQNRIRINSLYSTQVKLSGTGFPTMRASLAIGTSRQVRLRAGMGISGSELDLGSNEQIFWVWLKRSQPPATYFGYHDRYAGSALRHIFPVRPEWLPEALGLVYIDPAGQHHGPYARADGRVEVRSTVPTPEGQMTRVLVIHKTSGWVQEQHLFDQQGRSIARAYNTNHLRDPISGATLPRRTILHWPATSMELTVDLNDLQINPTQLGADLWTKPNYPGFPDVDVTQPSPPPAMMPAAARTAPVGPSVATPGGGQAWQSDVLTSPPR
jgi:hypothetical protein